MQARSSSRTFWLHIAGLWALAVVQPLFDLLARSPEFFAAHHAGAADILLLVAGLTVAGPLALGTVVWVSGLAGRGVRDVVLVMLVAVLAGTIGMQAATHVGLHTAKTAIPVAAIGAVLTALAYRASAGVRSFFTLVSVAAIAVPAWFLFQPQVRRLWAPREAAALNARPGAAPARDVPVVLVVLDETPLVSLLNANHTIDSVLYPSLAALARDGIWFRNTTTVSDYTRWALPAIVSGQQPRPDAAPDAGDYPRSVFTMLAPTHRVESVEAVTRLCPTRVCGPPPLPLRARMEGLASDCRILFLHLLLTDDLKGNLPRLTDNWANFGSAAAAGRERRAAIRRHRRRLRHLGAGDDLSERAGIVTRFIHGISADDRQPTLYFLHTMVSHTPYELLPTGQTNGTRADSKALRLPNALPGTYKEPWPDDEWAVAQTYQRHLMQIEYADALVGQLVQRLRTVGLYDRALVIVMADHGTVIEAGVPRRDYLPRTAAEIARVPLIIKFPEGTPLPADPLHVIDGQRVSEVRAETIDVLPTIAAALGMRHPSWADGVSLLDQVSPDRVRTIAIDSATHAVTLDDDAIDVGAALHRKLALFGSSDNRFRLPRPPRYAGLIGKEVASLRTAPGGGTVRVDYLSELEPMDTGRDPVPFDVSGQFDDRRGEGPTYVAVAINGVVRAVTRTWIDDPRRWLATPPLTTWRNGHNALDVYVITAGGDGPVLLHCSVGAGREVG